MGQEQASQRLSQAGHGKEKQGANELQDGQLGQAEATQLLRPAQELTTFAKQYRPDYAQPSYGQVPPLAPPEPAGGAKRS